MDTMFAMKFSHEIQLGDFLGKVGRRVDLFFLARIKEFWILSIKEKTKCYYSVSAKITLMIITKFG